jgi:LuxR family maltose regulon positive regulatory protein
VCAPAGFGKTATVAEWARQGSRPVAWVSLDAADNDPVRFWRYVAAAVDGVRPGAGDPVVALLSDGQGPPLEAVVTVLINELAAAADEISIVLDDYHVIDSRPVQDSIAFMIDRLPPGATLVLASRAEPPLPLARWRAGGRLAELRADELRLSQAETGLFLREMTGIELPASLISSLHERTEGWAAGVQLAGLSLRRQPDIAGFVAEFSGSHRYILDYLTEEVLTSQTDQVRGFLLDTSVLDELSGPLCDAVTGRTDSQELLEYLEAAGLFLVPLDEVRGWWRYHHLFAELLRVTLVHDRPDHLHPLHRAAAAWHERQGEPDSAVRHAVAAGDLTWAARLIEQHVESLLRLSEGATMRRWLAALPAETLRSRARLSAVQAIIAIAGGQLEAAAPLIDQTERAYAATAEEPFEPSVGRAISVLANVPAGLAFLRGEVARLRGDAALAVEYGRRAMAKLGDADAYLRLLVRSSLAATEWLRGDMEQAERDLAEVVAERQSAGESYLAMRARYDLGLIQRAQGRIDDAFASYRQALETTSAWASDYRAHLGMAHVGLAGLLYEQNDLAAALDHVNKGVTLCRHLAFTQPLAIGLATLAQIQQAQGDHDAAVGAMSRARQVRMSPQLAALFNPVPSLWARLRLAQGDTTGLDRWVTERGLGAADDPSYGREPEHLVLARILLARSLPGQASSLLARLLESAVSQGRTGSVIEIRALQALALYADGQEDRAVETLAEALGLAWPRGYVRLFADEGAPMLALLARLLAARSEQRALARDIPMRYVTALMDACGRPDSQGTDGDRPVPRQRGLPEPLTDRELTVLRLIAAGSSNQRIAHDLVITLDTVKKHVSHILGKLGAVNRTEAVARARALDLIP